MEYRNIIFDLDGTIINSSLGVWNSLQYALKMLHYENIPDEIPQEFIGPPLQKSFKELFGFNAEKTVLAIEYFREYYGRAGINEVELYDGISELFENLYSMGHKVYVATSKLEKYAKIILENTELYKYLDDLAGVDPLGKLSKQQLIQNLIDKYRLELSETVMVGDTHYDIIGATGCGIDTVAVGYGFGKKDKLVAQSPAHYVDTVEELSEMFVGIN